MSPIDHSRLHPSYDPKYAHFASRRSTVFSAKGAVVTSQPLGKWIEILNKGGNAADAAIAVAAAMNVTEPVMTGLGGDIFCLFWDAKAKKVRGINGSGRAPKALNLELLRSQGVQGDEIPLNNLNSVTVPCAAAGWIKTVEEFGSGKLTMAEILEPAIRMAREGVPVHEITSDAWQGAEALLKRASPNSAEMLMPNGKAPLPSHIMTHPELADSLEAIAKDGHKGYYTGRIAQAIVDLVKSGGGVMTMEDVAECDAEVIQPIKYDFKVGEGGDKGVSLWECPPNGQGLTALVALGIVEAVETQHGVDVLDLEHNSATYLHILIEAMRLAFADTRYYVADPKSGNVPVDELLSKSYLASRAALINLKKATPVQRGQPVKSSDTIYLATSDKDGNSCSFIASNYAGFGTGAIPKGCGFTLQNRGTGFTLAEGHPNCVQGGKRPYHTIIPAMATIGDELLMSFGVMGGFMQPQGHVQVLLNKLRGFSAQACLDAPRFCISAGLPETGAAPSTAGNMDSEIWFEEGIPTEVIEELRGMGHNCEVATGFKRGTLGKGQIMQQINDPSGRRVWACGSDLRGDGAAMGQI